MDKPSYRQGLIDMQKTIADAIDGMAASLSATDRKAGQWTHDVAAFVRAMEVTDTEQG